MAANLGSLGKNQCHHRTGELPNREFRTHKEPAFSKRRSLVRLHRLCRGYLRNFGDKFGVLNLPVKTAD